MMRTNTFFWDNLAVESYKTILKTKPTCALAHNNLALAYLRINKPNKAIRSFERAIKSDPGFDEAYYHLASAFEAEGKIPQALRYYKKFHKLKQDSKETTTVTEAYISKLELKKN
jgi:tetratricopeptide (TPR) repeat protein